MGKKGGGRVRIKQVGPKAPAVVNPFDSMNIPPEEMINLPPKPDSNITHVWPLNETFSMDYKQFNQIYPNYIDSNKTVKRGRRISKEDAVPEPSVLDITHALQAMGIPHAVQPYKGYSRDPESQWDNPGRVLVDLTSGKKSDDAVSMGTDGAFDIDEMPEIDGNDDDGVTGKKKHLMREIARRLKTLPARTKRLEQKKKEEEEAEKKAKEEAAAAHKAASQKASSGTSGKKKKGKKKR